MRGGDGDEIFGDAAIYVVNADGSGLRKLTRSKGVNLKPAWSLDGKQIAFVNGTYDGDRNTLWVMNTDGSRPRKLATGVEFGASPAWRPAVQRTR